MKPKNGFGKGIAILLPVVILASCVTKFAPYYEVDFTAWPAPVLLNEGQAATTVAKAQVKDTVIENNPTMAYSYTTTDATGSVWRHDVISTWSARSVRKSNTPVAVQLYMDIGEGDPAIRLAAVRLRDFFFFLMGAIVLETTMDATATPEGRTP